MELMELIRRSQAGDQEAFAAIYDQYKNLVHKTAYLTLGNAHDADDALQEIFIQVYRHLDKYQPAKGAFTTWLHRITANHCLNRKRKRSIFLFPLEMAASRPARSAEGLLGEEQALGQAVRRLSIKLRLVVVLRYYNELSYAEIAQVLDVPLGTVKSRLALALSVLREDLANDAIEFLPDREVCDEM